MKNFTTLNPNNGFNYLVDITQIISYILIMISIIIGIIGISYTCKYKNKIKRNTQNIETIETIYNRL